MVNKPLYANNVSINFRHDGATLVFSFDPELGTNKAGKKVVVVSTIHMQQTLLVNLSGFIDKIITRHKLLSHKQPSNKPKN